MASTSGSGASATQYDVFLSFRGPDTRSNFTDVLYQTMVGQGIIAYRDSEELHAGDRIDDLLRAVGNSKICIPIFSRGYASSPWCLRELARMMELYESTGKPEILPIFFDVSASDVKLKTKLYVEDLEMYEQRPGGDSKEQWEAALRKVGHIVGWEVQRKPHGEVIKLVVKEVLRKLKVRQVHLDSKLVGVDERVEAIMQLLDVDSSAGVRFVGIFGMGGIGKTTLAKIVFNKLCPRFDGQCSFIGGIRESSNRYGLVDLQRHLESDIFDSRFVEKLTNSDEWMDQIRRAGSKKVLIVLDDLDKKEQLKKLVGGLETFGTGSIIIITTRNKRILDEVEGILTYEVKQMDEGKALELFSLHAFDSASPPDTHQILSQEVVSATGGLPLALEVIGSYLRRQNEEIWKEMPERLKNVPNDEVRDKLKISFDLLENEEKEIFLDIACFFMNEEKSRATYFWDACGLYPHSSLKTLNDLCLVKTFRDWTKKNTFGDIIWMHDQLRDLGRYIVRQECTRYSTGRRRLWDHEEALKVVRSNKRKDELQALNLFGHHSDPICITQEELERMPNLRFLELRAGTFVGDINNHLQELRWLSWDSPLRCTMANFHSENLVVLELTKVAHDENWGGWNILKMANKLKDLSLSRCSGLKRTPDFSGCQSLERLSLSENNSLQEVHSSIGKLKDLTHLDIYFCGSLRNLPEKIGGLVKMKHFSIQSWTHIEKLPYSIWNLASLSVLRISCPRLTSLPDPIDDAKHMSSLDLPGKSIMERPISIGGLTQLEFLSFSMCRRLQKIPESIGNLTSLQELDLSCTSIVELPDFIGNLKRLKVLRIRNSAIRRLPSSIGMLERLEELNADDCTRLEGELPNEIGKLSCLRILNLSNTRVSVVPTAINSLTQLQELRLRGCNELRELLELPSSLNCLHVQSTSLRLVSDLSNLTNLVELHLSNDFERGHAQASNAMQTLQLQWVGKLSKLEKLSWRLSKVPLPSTELGCLPRLRELTISGMDSFNSVVVGPKLSNLKNLSKLCLHRSPRREIKLDGLELLRDLEVEDCEFLVGLSIISSSMRKLCKMTVVECPKLLEIRFHSMMESLKVLQVVRTGSLGGLYGLSNSKKLTNLSIQWCEGLRVVEGLEELELLNSLVVARCGSLERLIDVSNSKIPNECRIIIWDCEKLRSTDDREIRYREYREMILERTRKTFNEDDEMEKDSEDLTEKKDSIDCPDSEDLTEQNDSIVCPDLEDSTEQNDSIVCPDLEDSTAENNSIVCPDLEDSIEQNDSIVCPDLEDSTAENDSIDCSIGILECICKPFWFIQRRRIAYARMQENADVESG